MKSMSGKELAKLLEANGWDLLRIQGSHHIYGQAGNPARISVPIHRNQDMKTGATQFTQNSRLTVDVRGQSRSVY
jgi:predicted RNA binding protein YcfA (HicA-like mRNA interferase family)